MGLKKRKKYRKNSPFFAAFIPNPGELDKVTKQIEKLESRLQELQKAMATAGFYDNPETSGSVLDDYAQVKSEIDHLYEKWSVLETE